MTKGSLAVAAALAAAAALTAPGAPAHEPQRRPPPTAERSGAPAGPLGAEERARYAAAGRAIVEALAAGDLAAFRALHSAGGWESSDEWWRTLLAPQRESFGAVTEAWGPHRGAIRCGGFEFREEGEGATVVVRFEAKVGAALTFVLDPDGKVAGGRVFVSEGLGAQAPDGLPVLWRKPTAR